MAKPKNVQQLPRERAVGFYRNIGFEDIERSDWIRVGPHIQQAVQEACPSNCLSQN